jgi:hypothetical protein
VISGFAKQFAAGLQKVTVAKSFRSSDNHEILSAKWQGGGGLHFFIKKNFFIALITQKFHTQVHYILQSKSE